MKTPSSALFPMHGEFTGNNLQVQLLHVGLIDPFPSLSKVISLKKKKKQQQLFPPAAAHSYRGQSSCGFITPPPGYSTVKNQNLHRSCGQEYGSFKGLLFPTEGIQLNKKQH